MVNHRSSWVLLGTTASAVASSCGAGWPLTIPASLGCHAPNLSYAASLVLPQTSHVSCHTTLSLSFSLNHQPN